MIYSLLKQIIRLTLFFFFRKIVVTGKEGIPEKGPIILVANHPNTFMDPLLIAAMTRQRIGFVANAGIFVNKMLRAIFSYFHVIPIFRKQDIVPGEKPDNKRSFLKCHEYLSEGGTLLIFPEGTSHYELKLRDIKTGTARIALSYEELRGFEGNLNIVPIALDYSDSIQFRSVVSITVCRAIDPGSYRSAYESNEYEAVQQLTEEIRKSLADIVPQTSGKEQEEFLVKAHHFYGLFGVETNDAEQSAKRYLQMRNEVSKALRFIHQINLELYQRIQTKLLYFFDVLEEEGITPNIISNDLTGRKRILSYLKYGLKFFFLLPLYLFGLIGNYVPYILPAKIFKALKLDISYRAPVQMIAGLITFPLYYALMIILYRTYVSAVNWESVLLLISLPISGYLALYYFADVKRFRRLLRYNFRIKDSRRAQVLKLRDEILADMEFARQKYISDDPKETS